MGRFARIGTVVAVVLLLGLGVRGCVNAVESDTANIEVKGQVVRSSVAAADGARADAQSTCQWEPSWFSRLLGFSPPAEVVVLNLRGIPPFRLATVNCKTAAVSFGGRA